MSTSDSWFGGVGGEDDRHVRPLDWPESVAMSGGVDNKCRKNTCEVALPVSGTPTTRRSSGHLPWPFPSTAKVRLPFGHAAS